MILAGLVLGAALTTYLMVLQADRRATAEATAGMDETASPSAADSRVSENHVTEGSIGSSTPPRPPTKNAAVAPQPVMPAPVPAPAPMAAAPAAPAPAPAPSTAITEQAQPQPQPAPAPSAAVASVNVPNAATPKVVPALRAQRGRDNLDRRYSSQGATPETEELVRQSSKLDPLLPPPASAAPPSLNSANMDQHNTYRGSYHSGATQTDQLVHDSAKLDPSLPPPDMAAVRAATEKQQRSTTKPVTNTNTNPVAAALTDQLVRDSAKLDPSLPPPK